MSGSETVFVAIGVIGFLFLLASLLIGDFEHDMELSGDLDVDHDIGSDGLIPSWFSMKMLAASMVGFGTFGYVSSSFGLPDLVSWPIALVGMLAVGLGTFFAVLKPLAKQQSNSLVSRQSYRGLAAKVTLSIEPGEPGIVRFYDLNGSLVTERATLIEGGFVPTGAEVFIVDISEFGVTVMPSTIPNGELE